MDAKELDGLLSGVPVEIARSAWGKDAITFLQSFYRLLAATEGSEDAIVRELRDEADLCRNETATDIADLIDEAASCIVAMASQFKAMKARAEKAEAERDAERKLRELGWSALDCPACGSHLAGKMENYTSLMQHAEAMAKLLRALNNRGGLGLDIHKAIDSVIDVYRAAHPKGGA